MSRHYIVLPAKITAQIDGQARTLTSAAVICGYDRLPHRHFFCNVSQSLFPDHIDEPVWASMFDPELDAVTSPEGFDAKLACMGITLPMAYKDHLRDDWTAEPGNLEVYWNADGTIEGAPH